MDVEFVAEQGMATPATSSKVWEEKVKELAGRGITIRQLLDFYSRLGQDIMYHFDPDESTTHDVVRQAIIPMSTQTAQAPLGHRGRSFEIVLRLRACSLAALDIWPDLSYEIFGLKFGKRFLLSVSMEHPRATFSFLKFNLDPLPETSSLAQTSRGKYIIGLGLRAQVVTLNGLAGARFKQHESLDSSENEKHTKQ